MKICGIMIKRHPERFNGISEEVLEESEAKTPRTNAAIEIFMGNFPNGGTRLTKSYFDDQDNNVTKDKAAKVRICEFSEKGELLASEEKRLE